MCVLLGKCNHKDCLLVGNDDQMFGLGHSSASYVLLDCFITTDTNILQCRSSHASAVNMVTLDLSLLPPSSMTMLEGG